MDNTNFITFYSNSTKPVWNTSHGTSISDLIWREQPTFPKLIWENIDVMWDEFWTRFPQKLVVEDSRFPKCNAWEEEDQLRIDFAVPYMDKKDLSIDVDTRLRKLTINGKAHQDDFDHIKKEISRTSFKRTLVIGQEYDLNNMSAELEDGLLKISIPKSEEEKSRFTNVKIK